MPQVYSLTCSAEQPNQPSPPNPTRTSPTCYPDNVPGPGSPRFDEAYFEISYIRAYTTGESSSAVIASATGVGSGRGTTTISTKGGVVTLGPDSDIPNASITSNRAVPSGLDLIACGVMGTVGLLGVVVGGLVV